MGSMGKTPSREALLADVLTTMSWKEIADKHGYTDARFLRKLANRWDLPKRRVILKPTKEAIESCLAQGMDIYELTVALGYSKNSWSDVYRYCREYELEFDFTEGAECRKREFSPKQISLLYGTLMGDGALRPTGNHYCLVVLHSAKQSEYVQWKFDILRDLVVAPCPYTHLYPGDANGLVKKDHEVCCFQTVTHPFLTKFREQYRPDKKASSVDAEWLSHVDELALAVWYMDDGTFCGSRATFCTNAFSLDQILLMESWFLERWGITAFHSRLNIVSLTKPDQYLLHFRRPEFYKLFKIIRPYIIPSMAYKIGER